MLIELMASSGYLMLNKMILRKFKANTCVYFADLCDQYKYWKSRGELQNGWFYITHEMIEERTGLTPYQQRQSTKELVDMGLIEYELRSMPRKAFIKINEQALVDFFSSCQLLKNKIEDVKTFDDMSLKNFTTCRKKISRQVVKKLHVNNNRYINNRYINNRLNNNTMSDDVGRCEEKQEKTFAYSDEFEKFWRAYPKKVGKGGAYKAFKKVEAIKHTLPIMLEAIEQQKQSEQWRKEKGQFIPHPTTWLNQRRWEDSIGVENTKTHNGVDLDEVLRQGGNIYQYMDWRREI